MPNSWSKKVIPIKKSKIFQELAHPPFLAGKANIKQRYRVILQKNLMPSHLTNNVFNC